MVVGIGGLFLILVEIVGKRKGKRRILYSSSDFPKLAGTVFADGGTVKENSIRLRLPG